MKVITTKNVYTSRVMNLCPEHFEAQANGDSQVQHGLHAGECDACDQVTTVVLDDETVGVVRGPVQIGDTATVRLRDENGNPISATGRVTEILGEDESIEAISLLGAT